jgi:hypothetical protein
MAVMQVVI